MKVVFTLTMFYISSSFAAVSNYDRVVRELNEIHQKFPKKTELFVLGQNDQAQDILGIRIKQGKSFDSEAIVVGTHHGNEVGAPKVVMQFITEALEFNQSSKLKNKLIHVIPVLNISGYNRKRRTETDFKGNLQDPNRDYPDPCELNKANFKLRSTKALAGFIRANSRISTAITVHGYVGTLTFPWGTYAKNTKTHDHNEYGNITEIAAKENNYRVGTHADLIYPAIGAFEDWTYYEKGIWSLLVEISYGYDKSEDARAIAKFIELAPTIRSAQNQHPKDCKRAKESGLSRP